VEFILLPKKLRDGSEYHAEGFVCRQFPLQEVRGRGGVVTYLPTGRQAA